MQRLYKFLTVSAYSLAWFLILPFPFEFSGWRLLGGYYLIRAKVPLTGDGFRHEMDISNGYYSHSWYLAVFVLAAIILGLATYFLARKLQAKKPTA